MTTMLVTSLTTFHHRRRVGSLLGTVLLALVLLLGSAGHAAYAAVGSCRADPIVTLSDGHVFQVTVDIGTDAPGVAFITYTLHGPRGTTMNHITYTGGQLGHKETLTFVADQDPLNYSTETAVQLHGPRAVATTAHLHSSGQMATVSGTSAATLVNQLALPPAGDD